MFNNNDLERAIEFFEYLFILTCAIIAIVAGIAYNFENMITNMFLMGFGWTMMLGSIYMIYKHFNK